MPNPKHAESRPSTTTGEEVTRSDQNGGLVVVCDAVDDSADRQDFDTADWMPTCEKVI